MRLCGFVSAMTGQPLSALAQSLLDPVELLGDGAQPFALMVLALLGGRREQDSFLADETLDPGEELQFLGKLRELLGVRQGGAQGCKCDHERRHRTRAPRLKGVAANGAPAISRTLARCGAASARAARVLEKDDVVIRARCGHGVPHALQSPLLAVGRLPTGMPGASAAAVSPRRLQKLLRRCLAVNRLPRLEHADLSKRMARHCG